MTIEHQTFEQITTNNYGPDRSLNIKWPWAYKVHIKPGQRVIYRFSFSARFENAIIIYSMPRLELITERGNYSRPTNDYEFINRNETEKQHIITGWHKPSPPDANKPWLHSPKFEHQGTSQVDIVGFADDQGRDQQYPKDPNLFRNALVSIVYY